MVQPSCTLLMLLSVKPFGANFRIGVVNFGCAVAILGNLDGFWRFSPTMPPGGGGGETTGGPGGGGGQDVQVVLTICDGAQESI